MENTPHFLIACITSSCYLHCAGCYSRAKHACWILHQYSNCLMMTGTAYLQKPAIWKLDTSGGCLAVGSVFFHNNSHGGAELCPFSLYSDINVKETSIRDALHSRLFQKLVDGIVLMEDHAGGCVLLEKRE